MYGYEMFQFQIGFVVLFLNMCAARDHEIEVNYDIVNYKLLHVNQMLEITCKNILGQSPPSWTYPRRLSNDPRLKFYNDKIGQNSLVINKAQVEDAGRYTCSIQHDYNGTNLTPERIIEVIVNEIQEVRTEMDENSTRLFCSVQAYPEPSVWWKIDYDNKEFNQQKREPVEDVDYWVPPDDTRVLVDKSEGRWTLRRYKDVKNAELVITNVTDNDSGFYYCFSRNQAGEESKKCHVKVIRGKSSSITIVNNNLKPETQDTVSLGTEILIICSACFVLLLVIVFIYIFLPMKKQDLVPACLTFRTEQNAIADNNSPLQMRNVVQRDGVQEN